MKDIMYDIFGLARTYIYITCLDLYKQESLSFIILLLLKSALIFLTLNTVLFFCFFFSSDDESDDDSICLYLFKLGY